MKRITDSRANNSVLLFALVILSITSVKCGIGRREYYTNPNIYLVSRLAHVRIIMLSDFYHSASLPFKTLVSLLSEWVTEAAGGKSKDTKVVLVLEDDKQIVDNLKSFISAGDWKPLVDYWLPYNSMEWLEFCADLRALNLRIDSLDSRPGVRQKISFDILGGEASNIFDDPSLLRQSKEEGAKYFVGTRDSLSARNVSAYLDSSEFTKAIIFYGRAHLVGEFVHKDVAGALPPSETGGYYLAHYLKERFGADSVLTVCQISPYSLNLRSSFYSLAQDSNIFFTSKEISSKDIYLSGLQPQDFDAFITRRELIIPAHPLTHIFSKVVVQADVSRSLFLKDYLPEVLAERYYDEAIQSLQLITGENFKGALEWQSWFKKAKYDGFARMESELLANQLFLDFCKNAPSESPRRELYDLEFDAGIHDMNSIPSENYWWNTIWPGMVDRIKIYDSIGKLWVGTAEEKRQARNLLVKVFGTPSTEPQDYLKLCRSHFYDVDYESLQ